MKCDSIMAGVSLFAALGSWPSGHGAWAAAPGERTAPAVAPELAGWRRGVLAAAQVGIQSFRGRDSETLGVGFRAGILLGRHIDDRVSLNGELTVDVANLGRVLPDRPLSLQAADLALAPLYHAPLSPAVTVVAGPRLGFWGSLGREHVGNVSNDTWSEGVILGARLGAFVGVHDRAALGGLVSLGWRKALRVCYDPYAGSERCASDGLGDGVFNIGLTAAALF